MVRLSFFSAILLLFLVVYPGVVSAADQRWGRIGCPHCKDDGSEISRLLRSADALQSAFEPEEALAELLKVLQLEPDNHEALSKAARAHIDIGDMIAESAPNWQERRIEQYNTAEEYARKAVQADPNSTWGHFYVAVSLGKSSALFPVSRQIEVSREIREAVEKAIAMDPNNGFAYHVYGVWHRKLAEIGQMKRVVATLLYWDTIPHGTMQKSLEYLRKAISLNPTVIASHLELAKTYIALQKWHLARQSLESVGKLPIQYSDDHLHKKNGEKLLQEIKNR